MYKADYSSELAWFWEEFHKIPSSLLTICAIIILALLYFIVSKLVQSKPDYYSVAYWDTRYKHHPNKYEWYLSYDLLKRNGFLSDSIISIKGLNFLEIGCGNSSLAEEMYTASNGTLSITSIDFSDECINLMKRKHPNRADKYLFMDARDLEFTKNSFGYVIDKGTLDALVSGNAASGHYAAERIFKEVGRVLEAGGTFFVVSCHTYKWWESKLNLTSKCPQLQHWSETRLVNQISNGKSINIYVLLWKHQIQSEGKKDS